MQNKGAIRLLIILLILVTLYQLSFTFFVLDAKKSAKEYGNGDYRKEVAYLDSMSNKVVYNFVWLKKYTLKECQERQINLGLDLQGGMNVILQVSVPNLLRELSNNSDDVTFNKALENAKKESNDNTEDFIDVFYREYKKINNKANLATIFAQSPQLRGQIDFDATNEEVIEVLKRETQIAIDNAFNILRTRIDKFGVTQPNIQQIDGATGRILVELPGVKDEGRVRNLLQQSAALDFYLTYESAEIWPILEQIDAKLPKILNQDIDIIDTNIVDTNSLITSDTTSLLSDTNNIAVNDTAKIDENLSKEDYLKEHPLIGRIYPSIDENSKLLPGPVIGYVSVIDTAEINRLLALPEVKALLPRDLKLAWTVKPDDRFKDGIIYDLISLKTTPEGTSQLGGDVIVNASHNFDQNKGSAEVSMVMNGGAAKKWAELTRQNVGKSIAIVLDGQVYSYPTVQGEISGGVSQITGNFTLQEAQDLANVLKSGKLPVKITIAELNHVGPSLGKESINAGFISFIIAFLLVLIYMFVYYNKSGLIANVALIANVFFIIGVLASLGAVLTLPGIAGIVLTLGMAVDANVIIFERIKEELKAGKGIKKAIADGYSNAYSAIIDGNVTTLLTGIILYIFGHGPIQGFATTLIIGILTSLFSAIFISRLIFQRLLDKDKEIKLSFKWSENILSNTKFDFIGKRKVFYIISASILLLGIISLAIRGLDLGVDFVGGRTYVIAFDKEVNTNDVSVMFEKEFDSKAEVKTYGSDNQVKITTKYQIDSEDENIESVIEEKMYNSFRTLLKDGTSLEQFKNDYIKSAQKVGPTIASGIKRSAILSIFFALVVIFLYIFIRFKNWQFGLGGTVAIFHDSLITLSMFSIFYGVLPFSLEIDQAFIAAILTVIGYSINDTVIIFDRIREYFRDHPKRDKLETMNAAINSTLTRTLNTSLTTLVVLFAIFMFGGTVIKGFVFALLVGILVGTYSSIFVAAPITYDTLKRKDIDLSKVSADESKQTVEVQNEFANETPEERQKRIEEKQRRDEHRKWKKSKKNKN